MILNAKTAEVIPGIRKAAILLITLGEQTSADLIKDLPEEDVQRVSREIALISRIESEQAEIGAGGVQPAYDGRRFYRPRRFRLRQESAHERLSRRHGEEIARPAHRRRWAPTWSRSTSLQKADPQQLAKFIHSEHPQTIALVLSHLNPVAGGRAAGFAAAEMRSDVALRMASLDQISPEIITKIAGIIGLKLKTLGEFSRESYGGVRAVAEMFNRLDSNIQQGNSGQHRDSSDANLVETIRHLMFVFEDLLLIDQGGLKEDARARWIARF